MARSRGRASWSRESVGRVRIQLGLDELPHGSDLGGDLQLVRNPPELVLAQLDQVVGDDLLAYGCSTPSCSR